MSFKKRIIWLISTLFIVVGSDQWSKSWAVQNVKGHLPTTYFFDLFKIIYAENTGAWGNLGGDWPQWARLSFLIYVPCMVLLGLGIYILISKKIRSLEVYGFSLVLAGGIGNIIDRIKDGFVVDFMYVGHGNIGTNIFNIADVVIMIGFGILIINGIIEKRQQQSGTN